MMTDHDDYDDPETLRVIGGVDTHKDVHVAAVLDELGRLLDTASFPAMRPATGNYLLAVWVTAKSWRSGSRGPARGVRACHGICGRGA